MRKHISDCLSFQVFGTNVIGRKQIRFQHICQHFRDLPSVPVMNGSQNDSRPPSSVASTLCYPRSFRLCNVHIIAMLFKVFVIMKYNTRSAKDVPLIRETLAR